MSDPLIIAIDGPAGSGKSTLARALSERLGLATLDTGACYRAIAAAALLRSINPDDASGVAEIAAHARLDVGERVVIDGIDVTTEIRTPDVNHAVSLVASNVAVRASLVAWQRAWASAHHGGVVEGRDIGTVVFPDAPIKIFLTASVDERARRRAEEGLDGIERRDHLDATRSVSPMTPAQDAWVIDSTAVGVDRVVGMVLERVTMVKGETR